MNSDTGREITEILKQAKELAQRYRVLTGKPLGIAGEVAEFEAARLLGIELVAARQAGYDAIRRGKQKAERLQIKGRCVLPNSSKSQRIGKIDPTKEFDAVLLVLMDESLSATAIYEAAREPVIAALNAPGSKARNKRGQLGVSKFKSIAKRIWPVTQRINDRSGEEKQSSERHEPDAKGRRGALQLDLEKYRGHLKGLDLSDEAKDEVLRTLWSIMQEFVDVAMGDNSVRRVFTSGCEISSASSQAAKGDKK
jgi:Family of unknown function (DUF6998)